MPVWDLGDEPLTARSPATKPSHVGTGAGFVDEDQAVKLQFGLARGPGGTRLRDVRPILLGRVNAFF